MHFAVYFILANRACSLRLSNIFIATLIVCVLPNFSFSGAFVNKI